MIPHNPNKKFKGKGLRPSLHEALQNRTSLHGCPLLYSALGGIFDDDEKDPRGSVPKKVVLQP